MTNLENQSKNSKPSEHRGEELLKKRRSFIKGSAVVAPVILTLRSGSIFASTSGFCKDPHPLTEAPVVNALNGTSPDTWLRAETTCTRAFKDSGNKDANGNIIYDEIQAYLVPINMGLLNEGLWYDVSSDNQGNDLAASGWQISTSAQDTHTCFVVVGFDAGKPTGLTGIVGGSNLNTTFTSCFTSLGFTKTWN